MSTQPLTIGRVVHYRLSQYDVEQIEYARTSLPHRTRGNQVAAGDVYPATVVRVNSDTSANLQVHLDGPDTHWATSRESGPADHDGRWFWPPRVGS